MAEELAAETRNAVRRAFGSRRYGLVVRRDLDTGVASLLARVEWFGTVSHSAHQAANAHGPIGRTRMASRRFKYSTAGTSMSAWRGPGT